ncbi:hypothetical protein GCM10010440_15920 [Kitasatospora cinereorecta]
MRQEGPAGILADGLDRHVPPVDLDPHLAGPPLAFRHHLDTQLIEHHAGLRRAPAGGRKSDARQRSRTVYSNLPERTDVGGLARPTAHCRANSLTSCDCEWCATYGTDLLTRPAPTE